MKSEKIESMRSSSALLSCLLACAWGGVASYGKHTSQNLIDAFACFLEREMIIFKSDEQPLQL